MNSSKACADRITIGMGIFQDYYQGHNLREYSPSTISWIASLEIFVMLAGVWPIEAASTKTEVTCTNKFRVHSWEDSMISTDPDIFCFSAHSSTSLVSSWLRYQRSITNLCLHKAFVVRLELAASSPQVSPRNGSGRPSLTSLATNCVTTWFLKRRALAIGIVAAGSSLGGVIFPIMINHLIPEVGYGWAIRISALLILILLLVGNLTLKTRFAPSPKPLKLYQYFKPLTETPYLLTTIASFLFYLGLFLPINYIQVQSTEYGMSPHLASYMIPILNAARSVCSSTSLLRSN